MEACVDMMMEFQQQQTSWVLLEEVNVPLPTARDATGECDARSVVSFELSLDLERNALCLPIHALISKQMESVTIHTVHDLERDTTSPRKRKYASKACSSCRKLKVRCRELSTNVGELSCENCSKHGIVCSWPEEDLRKRGKASSKSEGTSHSRTAVLNLHGASPVEGTIRYEMQQDELDDEQSAVPSQSPHSIKPTTTIESSSYTTAHPYTVLQYYRYLGSTAIVPGYKKVSLKVAKDGPTSDNSDNGINASLDDFDAVFDPYTNLPRAELLPYLLDAFFEYYGSNFCFLNRGQLEHLVHTNEISGFLLCSIAALSSRFCSPEIFAPYFPSLLNGQERQCWQYSLPFLSQAKKLLMPLLSVPSCDLVAGLLFLALAEFGDNNEAGKLNGLQASLVLSIFRHVDVYGHEYKGSSRTRPTQATAFHLHQYWTFSNERCISNPEKCFASSTRF